MWPTGLLLHALRPSHDRLVDLVHLVDLASNEGHLLLEEAGKTVHYMHQIHRASAEHFLGS
jgi:hypothetical protein